MSSDNGADHGNGPVEATGHDESHTDSGAGVEGSGDGQTPRILKIGDQDDFGHRVTNTYYSTGTYQIYEIDDESVSCQGTIDVLGATPELRKSIARYGEYSSLLASERDRQIFNSRAAYAMSVILGGSPNDGVQALNSLIDDTDQSLQRKAKFGYIFGGLLMMMLSLTLVGAFYAFGWIGDTLLPYWLSAAVASMGGVMSISIGIKSIDIDYKEPYWRNWFYGALRITIALISGVAANLLVESKFVFAFLKDLSNPTGYLVAAFFSGFSEMFIPNVLTQLNNQQNPPPSRTPSTAEEPHEPHEPDATPDQPASTENTPA